MIDKIVGWDSDTSDVCRKGKVVAESGGFLVILQEEYAVQYPGYSPFVVRRTDQVRIIEK